MDRGVVRMGDATQKQDRYIHRMHSSGRRGGAHAFAPSAMLFGLDSGPLALSSAPIDVFNVVENPAHL